MARTLGVTVYQQGSSPAGTCMDGADTSSMLRHCQDLKYSSFVYGGKLTLLLPPQNLARLSRYNLGLAAKTRAMRTRLGSKISRI